MPAKIIGHENGRESSFLVCPTELLAAKAKQVGTHFALDKSLM
ncbi:MAG: hypothetical protein ACK40X_07035 [Armatimonadota bacterium]